MTFTENDKLKALAIVHVFETSRPFGDYAACVVLNDGAGVSYGINQFTHRSGSLRAVVEKYLNAGGQIGRDALVSAMPTLGRTSVASIGRLASDASFKRALRAAAATPQMQEAQSAVAFEKYLRPALDICRAKGFVMPLSLVVVYDSVTHGSWERIAASVTPLAVIRAASKDATLTEKRWITEYVRRRHLWLTNLPRLRITNYRTKFFLDQIATGNWALRLPINVHGLRLTDEMFTGRQPTQLPLPIDPPPAPITPADGQTPSDASSTAGEVASISAPEIVGAAGENPPSSNETSVISEAREVLGTDDSNTNIFESAGQTLSSAANKFDRVDGLVSAVATRKDAAKSLWTTIVGTIWQAVWAVFGFLIGLPRIVWIVVAVVAAVLSIIFLYRQLVLGRLREISNLKSEI